MHVTLGRADKPDGSLVSFGAVEVRIDAWEVGWPMKSAGSPAGGAHALLKLISSELYQPLILLLSATLIMVFCESKSPESQVIYDGWEPVEQDALHNQSKPFIDSDA